MLISTTFWENTAGVNGFAVLGSSAVALNKVSFVDNTFHCARGQYLYEDMLSAVSYVWPVFIRGHVECGELCWHRAVPLSKDGTHQQKYQRNCPTDNASNVVKVCVLTSCVNLIDYVHWMDGVAVERLFTASHMLSAVDISISSDHPMFSRYSYLAAVRNVRHKKQS